MTPSVSRQLRNTTLLLLVLGATFLALSPASSQGRRARRETVMVDGHEAVAGEVLVRYRDPRAANEHARAEFQADADEVEMVSRRGLRRMHSRRHGTQALLAILRANPDVELAEPNYVIRLGAIPIDPSFGNLWGLLNTGQVVGGVAGVPGADISATLAWNITTGSRANVVAVIDTGVDYLQPDLIANMWSAPAPFSVTIGGVLINCAAGTHGFNAINNTCDPMDDHTGTWHGTHVSGTIGAVGNNTNGVVGVNWIASIMGAKFLSSSGSGTTADAIKAIEFIIQAKAAFAGTRGANVRVLSNSWGGGGFSQALLDEINRANASDMLFVAAAGNAASNNDTTPSYPASYAAPNVISVAATNNRDQLASFSNFGRNSVHLAAPGVNVLSTIRHGGDTCSSCHMSTLSGTSMATPHVSGAAALLLSACTLTTAQLKSALLNNVDPVASLGAVTSTGGRLNANRALQACLPVVTADLVTPSSGSGPTQTFVMQYGDTSGATDLSVANVWLNTNSTTTSNSCLAYYDRVANSLNLLNDAGTSWLSGTLGAGGTLENSSCAIPISDATATPSGNTLTFSLAVTFKPAFAGTKNIYLYAGNALGVRSGWQNRGSWTVPNSTAVVTADSVTPSTGTGVTQTFALQYSDTLGATDLAVANVWFHTNTSNTANSCLAYYDRAANTLNLMSDAGTSWLSGTMGTGGTLQNGSCAIALGSATAIPSGTALTLTLTVTFKPAFVGTKTIYLYGANATGVRSGWQPRGSWIVPAGTTVTADIATPNSGTGTTQAFSLQYSDTAGAADLAVANVWLNTNSTTTANSCLAYYGQADHTLNLLNDAGTSWLSGVIGAGGTLQNSMCSLPLASATATPSGTTLTLNLVVTFKPAFVGTKTIYLYGGNATGIRSGWQSRGSWSVP